MRVKNRDGDMVEVRLDKITDRINELSADLDKNVIDPVKITMEVVEKIHDGISTSSIDSFTAEICHSKTIEHPHFNILASRLIISDHHKNVQIMANMKFSNVCYLLYNNTDQLGEISPLISKELYDFSKEYSIEIDSIIDNKRDFLLDYFGFKTLYKGYLLGIGGTILETPQYMWMRVAIGIHGPIKTQNGIIYEHNFDLIKETYNLLSMKYFTHATPTLYNAGTTRNQLSSCFLLGMDDNIESIFKVLSDTAKISKWAGGIGIHPTAIRSNNSYIRGTGGNSDGIVPMLKVFNDTARYINQGGKRSGSFAMYIEPWHADIEDFLKCKLPHGDENRRAKDLFYALWVPNLFMERVEKNELWSLMCPSECPGLDDLYGKEFEKLYEKYETEGRIIKTISARALMEQIITSQIETGMPYMCYKDAVNYKSNQKNVGVIKSSNLCAEIMEYSDTDKYACCVLGSVVLPTYVTDKVFDHKKLQETVKILTRNLNKIIDINYYPVKETRNSNMSERPIGVGVQGLADVFFKLKIPYDSDEAIKIDKEISETIYFAALSASVELSKNLGSYDTYKGSPISKGHFQFDLWTMFPGSEHVDFEHSGRYDWNKLRKDIKKHGVRNSLVTAWMPTASTSQIMGSASESFEPITSNCYTRKTKAGDYIQLNPYMAKDLIDLGLWKHNMKDILLETRGSIQNISWIPQEIRDIYKTVWEIKQKNLIDHSVARAVYIDQSQSLNLYFDDGDFKKIFSSHIYTWKRGLKTGLYYLRTQPASNATSFTKEKIKDDEEDPDDEEYDEEGCIMCSG
jgi:ribonucleoside-diphosphate reductase alpha chain